MARKRVVCPVCGLDVAVTLGARIYRHGTPGERCSGSGVLMGPVVQESVRCPTCRGLGVIRPGVVRR